jgi:hypothetical protein
MGGALPISGVRRWSGNRLSLYRQLLTYCPAYSYCACGTALRFATVAVSLAALGYGVDGLVKARRVGNGRAVAWVGVSLSIALFVMTALVVKGLVDWRFRGLEGPSPVVDTRTPVQPGAEVRPISTNQDSGPSDRHQGRRRHARFKELADDAYRLFGLLNRQQM